MSHRRIHSAPSFLTLLIVLVLGLGGAMAPAQAAPIRQELEGFNILLGRPTDDSITVNVIPDQSGEISFQYGTASGVYGSQTAAISCTVDEPVEVVIDGLTSNARYYYRLRFREAGETEWTAGDEHSFHTQRAPGSTFTFTIISDSHLGNSSSQDNQYRQTLLNVDDDNPDFHLDLGDTFMTDWMTTQSSVNNAYRAQRPYMGLVGHSASIFAVPGNHDNEEGWNLDDSPSRTLMSINARKVHYPTPIPDGFYTGNTDTLAAIAGDDDSREDYYAWEWGDALFVVLDPFQYTMIKPYATGGSEDNDEAIGDRWDWTLGQQQYNWFKQTLENSDATFKFVFAHHMLGGLEGQVEGYVRGGAVPAHMFEWGGYDADGTTWGFDTERPGLGGVPIHQFMVANGVNAFMHGHDHQYAYEMRDEIVYQSVPRPSTGMDFNYYDESDPYTIRALPSPGHIRVTVSPSQAIVDYVGTSSGTVNYSYTIEAEPSPEPTILGDLNGDDTVNSTEALIILSCDVGIDTSQFCPMNCGDVNDDGLVNSTDALIILSYDVGIAVPFPVGETGCPSSVTPCPGCTP